MPQITSKYGIQTPAAGDNWRLVTDLSTMAGTIETALDQKADKSAVTPQALLASLISVDGPGSGLDADTLDGKDSSAFAPATHTHDDRYYTESEIDAKLNGIKAGTNPWGTIKAGDDLNSYKTAGLYYLPYGTALPANTPATIAGGELGLEVLSPDNSAYIWQRLQTRSGGTVRVFERYVSAGTWTAWVELTAQPPVVTEITSGLASMYSGWTKTSEKLTRIGNLCTYYLTFACGGSSLTTDVNVASMTALAAHLPSGRPVLGVWKTRGRSGGGPALIDHTSNRELWLSHGSTSGADKATFDGSWTYDLTLNWNL